MADTATFTSGWRDLSLEDRGLLLTLACGSKSTSWTSIIEVAQVMGVDEIRAKGFVDAAVGTDVMVLDPTGRVSLLERSGDLRRSWERRFDEIFWPAVTTPWRKIGRAHALRVWMASTFALIKPKSEKAADALCAVIIEGVETYKKLLSQPNAPQMKYPQGWLQGQRWIDELDARFIEQHGREAQQPSTMSPLERARRQQAEHQLVVDSQHVVPVPVKRPASKQALVEIIPDRTDEFPDFTVSL